MMRKSISQKRTDEVLERVNRFCTPETLWTRAFYSPRAKVLLLTVKTQEGDDEPSTYPAMGYLLFRHPSYVRLPFVFRALQFQQTPFCDPTIRLNQSDHSEGLEEKISIQIHTDGADLFVVCTDIYFIMAEEYETTKGE